MKELLHLNGYWSIKVFAEGESFLSSFAKGNHDLVLLDLFMPGVSGEQIFDKIIKIENNIKVIFVTGNTESIENTGKSKNLAGVIKKPFDNNELLKIIDDISVDVNEED